MVHWHETTNGYVVVQDADGFWRFAKAQTESPDLRSIPDAIVGRTSAVPFGLRKHDLPTGPQIRDEVRRLQHSNFTPAHRELLSGTPKPAAKRRRPRSAKSALSLGKRTVRCIVILAAFDDHWDNVNGCSCR
jgi:hypothetical protein